MQTRILFIIIFSIQFSVHAFPQIELEDLLQFNTNGYIEYSSMLTDNEKNLYVACNFTGNIDADPGTASLIYSAGIPYWDILVLKFDSIGNLLNAAQIGGIHGEYVYSMDLDPEGNIILGGNFESDTIDFDPGPGIHQITITGSSSFILKLDSVLNFVWVQSFGGTANNLECEIEAVSTDDSSNVFFIGRFFDTLDFDPGTGVYSLNTTINHYGGYVCKLDKAGNFKFALPFVGNGDAIGESIFLDSTNHIYVAFTINDTIDFDPLSGIDTTISDGFSDIVILKMDSIGNLIWKYHAEFVLFSELNKMILDKNNNVYACGQFYDTADFNPGSGNSIYSTNGRDMFILKIDSFGVFEWVKPLGDAYDEECMDLTIGQNNDLFFTGNFEGSSGQMVELDSSLILKGHGSGDIVIGSISSAGNINWGFGIGGNSMDKSYCILFDGSYLYNAGIFLGSSIDLDPTPETISINNFQSYSDGFITKNKFTCRNFSEIDTSTCFSFTVPSSNQTYTLDGIYKDTLTNQNGCDSIIYFNVLIRNIDLTIDTTIANFLIANQFPGIYRWVDCDNNYTLIPGQMGQAFSPLTNGNYAVIITYFGCKDTSTCISYNHVSISEFSNISSLNVWPNPTSDKLNVEFQNKIFDAIYLEIKDVSGKIIRKFEVKPHNKSIMLDLYGIESGLYFLSTKSSDMQVDYPFIKL